MLVPITNGKCYDLLRRGLELRFLCVAKAAHFFILLEDKIMFDNIGSKLKTISSVFCIIGIILSIVGGVVLMFANFLIGFLVALFGSVFSWLATIGLYGIGEAADNSAKILKILQNGDALQLEKDEKEKIVQKKMSNLDSEQIEKLNKYGISFAPTVVFRNVFSTAAQLRSADEIISCLESSLEILKHEDEKEFVSQALHSSNLKELVHSVNNVLSKK